MPRFDFGVCQAPKSHAHHGGPEGRLLAAVVAYERGDFAACAQRDVGLVNVANAYWHTAGWADYATAMVA